MNLIENSSCSEFSEKYLVVTTGDNKPIIDNNKLLLCSKYGKNFIYVDVTAELLAEFGIQEVPEVVENQEAAEEIQKAQVSEGTTESAFVWSHKNTLLFLDEYKKRSDKFRNPKFKKKLLWDEISYQMRLKGYDVNGDTLDRKMRNMKHTYKNILDNNNKKKTTGRGRIEWEYFSIFNEIFQDDKTINLTSCMSSIIDTCSKAPTKENVFDTIQNVIESKDSDINCDESVSKNHSISTKISKNQRAKSLDKLRKRQLDLEAEKLQELKKIRTCLEENTAIQKQKLDVLKTLVTNSSVQTQN